MKKTKKFVSILLALVLTVSSFSILSAVTASAVTDTKVYVEIPDFWGEVKWNSKHTQAAVYCHLYRIYGGSPLKETTSATKAERCEWEHDNVYSFDTTALGTLEEGADYGIIFCADNTQNVRYQTCDMTMGIQCLGDTMIATHETRPNAVDSERFDYVGKWTDPTNKELFGAMNLIDSLGNFLGGKFPPNTPKAKLIADRLYDPAFKMKTNAKYFTTQRFNELEAELGVTAREVYDQYVETYKNKLEENIANGYLVDMYDKDGNPVFLVPTFERVAERLGITNGDETTNEPIIEPVETTVEPTTAEPTIAETTNEPVTEPEPVYVVAGSTHLFGDIWYGLPESGNIMVKDGDIYTFTIKDFDDIDSEIRLKIVENIDGKQNWYGEENGSDVAFVVPEKTDLTITFDPATKKIQVIGDDLLYPPEPCVPYQCIRIAGNDNAEGTSDWLHGKFWDPAADENIMQEIEENVFSITFDYVTESLGYEFNCVANGNWNNYWGTDSTDFIELESNITLDAAYNQNPVIFDLDCDSKVTITLDLRDFDYATKEGAKISIEAVPVEKEETTVPATEPTTAFVPATEPTTAFVPVTEPTTAFVPVTEPTTVFIPATEPTTASELLPSVADTKIYFEVPTDKWGEVKWNSKHTQAAVYCHLYRIYGGSPLKETTFATKHERCTWEHDNVYSFDTTALGTIEEGADYGVIFCADCVKDGETVRYKTCDMTMGIQCLGDTVIVKDNPYLAPSDSVHEYIGEWKSAEKIVICGEKSYIDSHGNITPGKLPLNMPKAKHIADRLYQSAFNMKVSAGFFTTERLNELEAALGVTAREVYVQYVLDYKDIVEQGVASGELVDKYDKETGAVEFLVPTAERVAERLGIAIPVFGDVDGDGEASINDVTEIQMYLAKLCELSFTQTTLADVDGDGQVSINDA
ncbi:MAG: dockerin type I domain-containing protein, partial [Ruminococcus sp.]|nr:dockerin type I domain-containing protein [Ruminococcus sp.]